MITGAGSAKDCTAVAGTITVVVPVGASNVAAKYTKYNSVNTAIAATTQMPSFDMKTLHVCVVLQISEGEEHPQ